MNPNDPFSALGIERTIIKPNLGRMAGTQPINMDPVASPNMSKGFDQFEALLDQYEKHTPLSENPVINTCSGLLRMACAVGQMPNVQNLKSLSETWRQALIAIEHRLEQLARPHAERMALRYTLCSFLDERAANTPWGGSGNWAPHSQLLHFFSETWGGEKVFTLIQKISQSPVENRDLMEVMALVLSLGFRGKYQVLPDGETSLERIRSKLFKDIQYIKPPQHGQTQALLHPAFWRSLAPPNPKRHRLVPLWLPFSAMALIACLSFLFYYLDINERSDKAYSAIANVTFPAPKWVQASEPAPPVEVGLQLPIQLQNQIMSGDIKLRQVGNRSTVVFSGDGLFDSGSAELRTDSTALVAQVGQALAKHKGIVLVTGYSDNVPIRSLRFPSNWELSAARADNVGKQLHQWLPASMVMKTEGAGSANPVADNATAQGRALNRRVEITLQHLQ